jgi:hypothetical protein
VGVGVAVAAVVEVEVAAGVAARVATGVGASAVDEWLSRPAPSAGVTVTDGTGDAAVSDAAACGADGVSDGAGDAAGDGAAGAKITVGASVTTGRAAIVTRCDSSGVQGRALAR